MSHFRKDPCQ